MRERERENFSRRRSIMIYARDEGRSLSRRAFLPFFGGSIYSRAQEIYSLKRDYVCKGVAFFCAISRLYLTAAKHVYNYYCCKSEYFFFNCPYSQRDREIERLSGALGGIVP